MTRNNDKRRNPLQSRLGFSDEPKQVNAWVWVSREPEGSCPGCGRPPFAGTSHLRCCVLRNGRVGAFVFFCATEYHRTRGEKAPDVLMLQTQIDQVLKDLLDPPEVQP